MYVPAWTIATGGPSCYGQVWSVQHRRFVDRLTPVWVDA